MENEEKTKEIELAISRPAQACIGAYLDRHGFESEIDIEEDDELEELSVLFWGNKSRDGLNAYVSINASRDDLNGVVEKIFTSNNNWWERLNEPLAELNHSYRNATGESLYELLEIGTQQEMTEKYSGEETVMELSHAIYLNNN